jgi:hypothetical protein
MNELEDRKRYKTAALGYKCFTLKIHWLVITAIAKCVSNLFLIFFSRFLKAWPY